MDKKVHLRHLLIEVGTGCNLRCRHCYIGNSPIIAIKPEYIDALIENASCIDEISFTGGEIALYLDTLEMILSKFRKNKMKINYVNFVTNGVIRNERLVKFFNDFKSYTTFKVAEVHISVDKFHLEQSGMTMEELQSNVDWYSNRVGETDLKINDVGKKVLFLDGRANTDLSWSDIEEIPKVGYRNIQPSDSYKIVFNSVCENGACDYGHVCNCVVSSLYLRADGNLFPIDGCSYDDKNMLEKRLCHIEEKPIYDAIKDWNDLCDENKDNDFLSYITFSDNKVEFQSFLTSAYLQKFMLDIADAYLNDDVRKLDEIATRLDNIVEKWNKYLVDYQIQESVHTVLIKIGTDALLNLFKVIYCDVCDLLKKKKTVDEKKENPAYAILIDDLEYKTILAELCDAREKFDIERYKKAYIDYHVYASEMEAAGVLADTLNA